MKQRRRLRQLGAIHREMMRRLLDGQREAEVAVAMGMHPASVSRIISDRLFQEVLIQVMERTQEGMRDLHRGVADIGVDALVSLSRLLKDEKVSARVRFQIAKEILDRGLG